MLAVRGAEHARTYSSLHSGSLHFSFGLEQPGSSGLSTSGLASRRVHFCLMMRKKVAIIGGAGRLGKYIVQDFLNHGWSVLSIDVVREVRRMCKSVACSIIQTVRTLRALSQLAATLGQGATTANANAENTYTSIMADLTDPGQAYAALAGCDAVVHMAAWANAGMVTDPRTFNDNTSALFNVLQAAAGAQGVPLLRCGPACVPERRRAPTVCAFRCTSDGALSGHDNASARLSQIWASNGSSLPRATSCTALLAPRLFLSLWTRPTRLAR